MVRLCITHRGGLIDHSQANFFLNEHDFPRAIHCSLQRCYLIFGTNETRGSKIPNVLMLMCSFFCYMHVFAHVQIFEVQACCRIREHQEMHSQLNPKEM
jgi:hypothetical protein